MSGSVRSIPVNSALLKKMRLESGLSQAALAKAAGYSERLVRKAEAGGSLTRQAIDHIAEALRQRGISITAQQLVMDHLEVARKWIEAWEQHERAMIPHVRDHLAEDMLFVCPGKPDTAPFIGTWKGIDGLQGWLDAFFSVFRRVPMQDAQYTVGENTVIVRWMESGYIGEHLCGPIRINMHFQFNDEGCIIRIDDDYDTQAGAETKAQAEEKHQP